MAAFRSRPRPPRSCAAPDPFAFGSRNARANGGPLGPIANPGPARAELDPAARSLWEALRAWRLEEARRQELPPYVIFHDSTLTEVARRRPASLAALAEIPGVGRSKLERYGGAVIAVVTESMTGTRGGATAAARTRPDEKVNRPTVLKSQAPAVGPVQPREKRLP